VPLSAKDQRRVSAFKMTFTLMSPADSAKSSDVAAGKAGVTGKP